MGDYNYKILEIYPCANVCCVIAAGGTASEFAVPVCPKIGFASGIGAVNPKNWQH